MDLNIFCHSDVTNASLKDGSLQDGFIIFDCGKMDKMAPLCSSKNPCPTTVLVCTLHKSSHEHMLICPNRHLCFPTTTNKGNHKGIELLYLDTNFFCFNSFSPPNKTDCHVECKGLLFEIVPNREL